MKCPRCKKTVKEMYQHCPFCGQKMPEKKNPKFGKFNLCLLSLAVLQTAAAGFLAFGLLSGRFAAHYLDRQNYDQAVRLLRRIPAAQSTEQAENSTQRAAEQLKQDSIGGVISYDAAQETISRLMEVSDADTKSVLSQTLLEIENAQKGEQIVNEILSARDTDGFLAAYEKIAATERSSDWYSYSSKTKQQLADEKKTLTEQLAASQAEEQHFFNDGSGKGALFYAAACSEWNDRVFPEINQKCLDYLNGIYTNRQWTELLSISRTCYSELENYWNMPGFSYGDYEALRQNALRNLTDEQTKLLLTKINQARSENRLLTLTADPKLISIARKLALSPMVSEQQLQTELNNLNLSAQVYYLHVPITAMTAEELFAAMQKEALEKQNTDAAKKTMLTAEWIDRIGIHMGISSFGTNYWFIIATGSEPENLG